MIVGADADLWKLSPHENNEGAQWLETTKEKSL